MNSYECTRAMELRLLHSLLARALCWATSRQLCDHLSGRTTVRGQAVKRSEHALRSSDV